MPHAARTVRTVSARWSGADEAGPMQTRTLTPRTGGQRFSPCRLPSITIYKPLQAFYSLLLQMLAFFFLLLTGCFVEHLKVAPTCMQLEINALVVVGDVYTYMYVFIVIKSKNLKLYLIT